MSQITIDVFSEGATEKGVIEKLCRRGICPHKMEERGGGGEDEMLRKLKLQLQEWFKLQPEARESLRILVLRDLDEGKTIERLCESVLNIVRRHQSGATLVVAGAYDHVFALQTGLSGLRIALHIANHRCRQEFTKSTIDDYVLALALQTDTAEALLRASKQKGSSLTYLKLIEKVNEEIPELLKRNTIPPVEAKDYVRFYAAVLREHTTPAAFAGKVLEHAQEEDIQKIFAPLLAAVQFLASDST